MVERVSTFGLSQTMLRSTMAVQSNYSSASTQKASGLVASTYGELGGKASSLISAETATSQLSAWQTNTQTADDRAQAMYSAVGNMVDLLQSLRSTITAAKSSSATSTDVNQTGTDLLSDLAAQMNLRQDGRYLFAGSNTGTEPVDISALSPASVPSSVDTAYYTGDSQIASVRVSGQQTISYGVTADGTGFEKSLRAANLLATMTTSPLDTSALDEAYDLATKAMDALIAVQSGLSTISERLESAKTRQTDALSLLDSMSSNLKEVDVAVVTVTLSSYQTQLEASYSALSKVSDLSLTKYL